MFPQRERILYSLAYQVHSRAQAGASEHVSLEELRSLCYLGTKLNSDEVELLLSVAKTNSDGLVLISDFVSSVSTLLLPQDVRPST